jgi:hypothetical protein
MHTTYDRETTRRCGKDGMRAAGALIFTLYSASLFLFGRRNFRGGFGAEVELAHCGCVGPKINGGCRVAHAGGLSGAGSIMPQRPGDKEWRDASPFRLRFAATNRLPLAFYIEAVKSQVGQACQKGAGSGRRLSIIIRFAPEPFVILDIR